MQSGGEEAPDSRNAFREAEKKYQLRWHQTFRYRRGRRKGIKLHAAPTDLSEALDPREHASGFTRGSKEDGNNLLTLPSHPGFVLLPSALSEEKQRQLIVAALTEYPEPPTNTNHTRQYGKVADLWDAAQQGLHLEAKHGDDQSEEQGNALAGPRWVNAAGGHPAHQLLKKLRWCTLGPQFDWTARVYDRHAAYSPLPEELRALALRLCASAAPSLPNLTAAADWEPDVALVNYYRQGDTLGGHKDDVEQDKTTPIVALSLGCDAIFLLGGHSKDEKPVAMRLRSGDAVILSGPARMCYHGVPRVFGENSTRDNAMGVVAGGDVFAAFAEHMRTTRINISIRASK